MHVRSFLPRCAGNRGLGPAVARSYPVKALATVKGQAIVTVAGKGMAGVHGIAAHLFGGGIGTALGLDDLPGVIRELDRLHAARVGGRSRVRSIQQVFSGEIASGLIDPSSAKPGMAVLAVVGDGMAGTPAAACSPLASAHINVVAIAQGSSERNISFAVNGDDAAEAARCVHAAFQLSKIGGGRDHHPAQRRRAARVRVGRALADQIADPMPGQPVVRVVGLLDRSGYRAARHLAAAAAGSGAEERWRRADRVARRAQGPCGGSADHDGRACGVAPIVDVTSEETGDLLRTAIGHGFNVVLANKKPLADAWDRYAALLETSSNGGPKVSTRRLSAPGCRSSIPTRSWSRPATACSASKAA